ncbi:SRPBCC family protein [Amycolatopsis sp. NPDC006125]|uniref:SRPBCC family protein n=1 Tax=Amycolatopsis sp. NPDC006125 TaxID=3156730 RepID=UPI0033BBDD02
MSSENGTIETDGEAAVIRFERHLPFPIETVWAAITDPARRRAWFGETVLDTEAGTIEMLPEDPPAPDDAKRMTGRILVWQPPHVFEHEWRQRIVEDGVVRYELSETPDGTLLKFTHRGLSVRNARGFIPGTHAFFDRLAAHLAGAEPPAWPERYAAVAERYPAWS